MPTPPLATLPVRATLGGVVLRDWAPDDAAALAHHANDRRIWRNLRDQFPSPYTLLDAERWIAYVATMAPRTAFAIAVDGHAVGGVGWVCRPDVEHVGAELGYWVGAAYWGKGIATAAVRAATRLAFDRHPELLRLFALPYGSNAASARVLEKAGYTLEGRLRRNARKDGVVEDSLMYAILREEVAGA